MIVYKDKEFNDRCDLRAWFDNQPITIESGEALCAGVKVTLADCSIVSQIQDLLFEKILEKTRKSVDLFGLKYFTHRGAEASIETGAVYIQLGTSTVRFHGDLEQKVKELVKAEIK